MPGKKITDWQRRLYMEARSKGKTQKIASAQAGFCERSARNIFKNPIKKEKNWRTRENPFQSIWESELAYCTFTVLSFLECRIHTRQNAPEPAKIVVVRRQK